MDLIEKIVVGIYNRGMEPAALHLDTYKIINLLKDKGFSEEQSEGILAILQQVTISGMATKNDTQELKYESLELKQEIKEDIQKLDVKVERLIATSRNELLKFQLIQTIAIIGVMVALFALF